MSGAEMVCRDPLWIACQTLRSQELYALIGMAVRGGRDVALSLPGSTKLMMRVDRRKVEVLPSSAALATSMQLRRRCRE